MSKDLAKFDSLKADVTQFVAPAMKLTVTSFETQSEACAAAKTVKMYLLELEKKRKELVGPLNDQVKLINGYAKGIEEPLKRAETHIKAEIARFDSEQEKIRREKLRIEAEAQAETERKAQEARRQAQAEIEARRQADLEALKFEEDLEAKAAALFGDEPPAMNAAEERAKIEAEAERARVEAQAQAEREAAARKFEAQQRQWDIDQTRTRNIRKVWKCEVTDIDQVPVQFLKRELNQQMVLAAARGGTTSIPGVRLWQESSVAIGANTYVPDQVPQAALAETEEEES